MSVDEDFEVMLRHRFQSEELLARPTPGLATHVIAQGVVQRRRRHRRVVGWVALTTVAVVAGAGLTTPRLIGTEDKRPPEHPPAGNRTIGTDGRHPVATWASELPRGDDPEVAYLAGTTVTLANGNHVDLRAITWPRGLETNGAEVIGQTVAGLVLLAGVSDARSGYFDSRFVLVEDDGDIVDMPVSTRTADASQGAVVSPDGRYFTNGGPVIDKETGAIVAEMPEAAAYLHAWTPAGIIYSPEDGSVREDPSFLWQIESEPIRLENNPGRYRTGTDIGARRRGDGCSEIVRISETGAVEPQTSACLPSMLTVSPAGTYGITTDFQVVDAAAGTTHVMADEPLDEIARHTAAFWESEDSVLIPVPGSRTDTALLVRCNARSVSCEQATDPIEVGPYDDLDLP